MSEVHFAAYFDIDTLMLMSTCETRADIDTLLKNQACKLVEEPTLFFLRALGPTLSLFAKITWYTWYVVRCGYRL